MRSIFLLLVLFSHACNAQNIKSLYGFEPVYDEQSCIAYGVLAYKKGDSTAKLKVADCFLKEFPNGKVELNEALKLLDELSRHGDMDAARRAALARFILGSPAENNIGLAKLEALIKKGDSQSAALIGSFYYHGINVTKSNDLAYQYYIKAAKTGWQYFRYLASHIYESGLLGQNIDNTQSDYWKLKAKERDLEWSYECAIYDLYSQGVYLKNEEMKTKYRVLCEK